jgi:hypothetical protein
VSQLTTRLVAAAVGVFLICGTPTPANGDPIAIFTFEQFTVPPADFGPRTPLVDVAPATGPADFRATFTTPPFQEAFAIARFPHSSFSGNLLIGLSSNAHELTVTFSDFITEVTFPFVTTGAFARLRFSSPSGSTEVSGQLTGNRNDFFTGGTLRFASETPFNTFTLTNLGSECLPPCDTRTSIGIDNLTVQVSPVPEPATLLLAGAGLAGVLRMRSRSRAR